jgi:FdhD protein
MHSPGIQEFGIYRFSSDDDLKPDSDRLTVEEPLEIVVAFRRRGMLVRKPVSITMRTPGMDRELAVGFLFTEGIVHSSQTIINVEQPPSSVDGLESAPGNTVVVTLDGEIDLGRLDRHFYTSSSCGVCGKASLEALRINREIQLPHDSPIHSRDFLFEVPQLARRRQSVFDSTGGLHAAAIFDSDQRLLRICEDIGRHNAVDKIVGGELLNGRTDFSNLLMFVSGRAGFELIQKSLMTGIPMMAAVGAPSTLSVELARRFGMTLIGFLRGNRFNLYSGIDRIRTVQQSGITSANSGRLGENYGIESRTV